MQLANHCGKSLRAWILLGQSGRYGDAMRDARAMRRAASERSVSTRREILRNAGFAVLTSKGPK